MRHTIATQTTAKSAGIPVRSSCTDILARNTCHGTTGRDCTSHRLLPSSETDGATILFIEATVQTAAIKIIFVTSGSHARFCPIIAARSFPFMSINTPSTGSISTPMPQFSI